MPRNRGARERIATGIYRDARGYSIVVVVHGEHVERRHPHGLSLTDLQRLRAALETDTARRQAHAAKKTPTRGTLAAAAPEYLASVRAMPSYAARAWQVGKWVEALGTMPRDDLTPIHVSTQLHAWHREGYAPQTCNHLRTALVQLYVRLDGKDARNPARAVPKFPVTPALSRALPVLAVAAVLRQFRPRSATRVRLAVIATTGLRHAELKLMKRADIDLETGVLVANGILKGGGTQPRTVPLTKHARLALRAFIRADAFGPFSSSSMRSRFLDACDRAGYGSPGWRPYDLRHTFATVVARASGDERAVQELLGHSDRKMTQRYTLGSVGERVTRAIAALDGANPRGQP